VARNVTPPIDDASDIYPLPVWTGLVDNEPRPHGEGAWGAIEVVANATHAGHGRDKLYGLVDPKEDGLRALRPTVLGYQAEEVVKIKIGALRKYDSGTRHGG
jgi:hypothetical protein